MNRRHLQEIRLKDFRCFGETQSARLSPLTLLVGENSTGKTSFLAAVRAVWEAAYQQTEPDFRAPPYDLGAFSEIVHNREGGKDGADSFEIGFTGWGRRSRIKYDVAFESHAAAPSPSQVSLSAKEIWLKQTRAKGRADTIDFGSGDGAWRYRLTRNYGRDLIFRPFASVWMRREIDELSEYPERLERTSGSVDRPSNEVLDRLSRLVREFSMIRPREHPFASAPIRSSPRRTYDPTRPLPDPEGAYVPTYFASMNFRDRSQWTELKEKLENFGRESDLFHEIGVKQLGDMEGGPFQLEVTKSGKRGLGQKRNLIDVGYGVSQALPVLAELFRPGGPPLFLFQQPEVHLHPSAQAALGSLFCSTSSSGRQLIVETHSEYIVDRVRMDIRDRETELKPDDVSLLFFERTEEDVVIHSLRFDELGNILDVPEGYGQFFMDEMRRSAGI